MKPLRFIIELLFWMLVTAIGIAAVLIVVGWLLTPVLGYAAVVALLVLLPLVARSMRLIRKRRATTVISYLEQAVRLNHPISRMLAAARDGESGKIAYRIEQTRRRIEEGFPVGDALRRAVPELAPKPVALISSGERLGRLPHALARALRDVTDFAKADASRGAFIAAYPFMMTIVICTVVVEIGVFVLPKFESIFSDHRMTFPPVTQSLIDVMLSAGLLILTVTVVALLWWAARGLSQTIAPSSIAGWWRIARDRVLWTLPVAHSVVRDRGLAEAFDLIADALRGGATADRAMEEATKLEVNDALQDRLIEWWSMLRAGATLGAGAKAARMPSLVVEILSSVRGPETADAFAFLSRHYATRFSRAAALIKGATGPATVLLFAFLVGWVALALFTPMTQMINRMADQISGWKL